MIAEVISIGDELTSGQRLDTNSQWISQQLGDLGIRTLFHTTVGDDLDANVNVFRCAFGRADVVICTGGLGPTADDLTRQAVAVATDSELVMDEGALHHIKAMFARRHREMPPRNTVQAMFPRGSRIIHNPNGTAPGIDFGFSHAALGSSRLFALPGVPAEMREMWAATVEPELRMMLGDEIRMIRHRRFKCFGVGESDLEQMLPDIIRRGRQPSVGITVHRATITLRITAEGRSDDECFAAMEPTIATIHECLGDLVFGEEDEELQDAVVRMLRHRSQTLSTIECGSGGLVGNWLSEADVEGSYYRGGIVVRGPESASDAIGNAGDASHRNQIRQMATHCRERFESDFALAIGPFPTMGLGQNDMAEKQQVVHAIASSSGVADSATAFGGHPDIVKSRTAKQALDFLRKTMLRSNERQSANEPFGR